MTTKNKSFREKVLQFIEDNHLFSKKDKLLIAFSGGVDSTSLAYFLHKEGFSVALAHVNFSLREEADKDQKFCEEFAEKLNIPCYIKKVHTRKITAKTKESVQEAARRIRYEFFYELLKNYSYDYILTAHHKDDNIETALFSLIKSKHYNIFKDISWKNNKIRRPFQGVSKSEIREFARKNYLSFVIDASNFDTKYQRNFLRLEIIPKLEELNPSFKKHFSERLEFYKQQIKVLNKLLFQKFENHISETEQGTEILLSAPQEQEEWKMFLAGYLADKFGFSTAETERIFKLINAQTGKFVKIRNFIAIKNKKVIILSREIGSEGTKKKVSGTFEYENLIFAYKTMNPFSVNYKSSFSDKIYFDADKISGDLYIRSWQEGDAYIPLGMQGKKKVSDILNELYVPSVLKKRIWLLEDAEGIVYVAGYRIAERIKIDAHTQKAGMLSWEKTNQNIYVLDKD